MGLNHSRWQTVSSARLWRDRRSDPPVCTRHTEDNPWFLDGNRQDEIIAPPMFGVVMGWLPTMLVMTDVELGADLLRLLHGEQDMYFYRTVSPGDIITSTAKILAIEEKATGESIVVEVLSATQANELVQRMLFTAFIRGRSRREKRPEEPVETPPTGEPLLRVEQTINADPDLSPGMRKHLVTSKSYSHG
jgi:hypothetical protein